MNHINHTVIITGAANGIGATLAKTYAKEGATVILADIDQMTGDDLAAEIEADGGTAYFYHLDVQDEKDVNLLIDKAIEHTGRIDIVINNAGIMVRKSLLELELEEWDRVQHTNLRSIFLTTKAAAPYLKKNPAGGRIVNLASTRAFMSEPDTESYAATKGGIVALTHALAVSLGPDRILVNAIAPGWIETGNYHELSPEDHSQHPSGRVGKPEDVARAALFLTNPDNDFLTGETLVLDGGMTRKMIYEE
ncbi:NAD(P)-dependent dehydrogenase (short-subunit alcohol dehydrogenase family) [Exiguobacterium sp. PvP048]|uniref:SDR family NAD(P)-dependent oxidoreductase n=1 Tax=Exiguobacterium TaxID=33986 RepID=UPI0029647953|nr:glucose 1-dehydrogenase [Exiguobacterium sibiricum]MDW2886648.1 SDR family oxidoreductase [Exiguobacterium sibiricum]